MSYVYHHSCSKQVLDQCQSVRWSHRALIPNSYNKSFTLAKLREQRGWGCWMKNRTFYANAEDRPLCSLVRPPCDCHRVWLRLNFTSLIDMNFGPSLYFCHNLSQWQNPDSSQSLLAHLLLPLSTIAASGMWTGLMWNKMHLSKVSRKISIFPFGTVFGRCLVLFHTMSLQDQGRRHL